MAAIIALVAARDELREIVERCRAGPRAQLPDDTRRLLAALVEIRRTADLGALPWILELWCSRPKSGIIVEQLGEIAADLRRWRTEAALGALVAEPGSFDRLRHVFDEELLREHDGVAFAHAVLAAWSFVDVVRPDGTLEARKFPHAAAAAALEQPQWIRLLSSLRDHDDLGDAARWALRAVPSENVPEEEAPRVAPLAKARGDALSRYRSGEREAAWQSLCDLGPLGPDARDEARAVAQEMMRVVRANAETIVHALRDAGYPFVGKPLGDWIASRGLLPGLGATAGGPPPVSLEVFWEVVGGIDLRRREDETVCELDVDLDVFLIKNALEVRSLADAWYVVEDWQEEGSTPYIDVDISADELHKEWTSGGAPYAIRVPNLQADGRVLREPHRLAFVPYLRLNFAHCGFLGYELDRDAVPYKRLVERVARRLAPF
jgi:hypothetical protein